MSVLLPLPDHQKVWVTAKLMASLGWGCICIKSTGGGGGGGESWCDSCVY